MLHKKTVSLSPCDQIMAHRSQCSSAGDNPLDPNYLPPHYREEYRLAIDALVERDLDGYHEFLQSSDVVDFLSKLEIEHIQSTVQGPRHMDKPDAASQGDEGSEGSSDTYWPMQSDLEAPSLDLGWPQQLQFVGPTEFATFVNPPDPAMPSIKTQARRLIKDAQLVGPSICLYNCQVFVCLSLVGPCNHVKVAPFIMQWFHRLIHILCILNYSIYSRCVQSYNC